MMINKYLFLSLLIITISISACGDKSDKEPINTETPKQEVIKPDTTEKEPIIEEVVEEVVPQERMVIVQEGEWLYDIARREYGSMHEWRKIYDANKDKISDPNLIFPDMQLVIPE